MEAAYKRKKSEYAGCTAESRVTEGSRESNEGLGAEERNAKGQIHQDHFKMAQSLLEKKGLTHW